LKLLMAVVALATIPTPIARSQIKSGTVLFFDFSQDQITLAADSRGVNNIGGHVDTDCKISALGSKFVFGMAGYVSRDSGDENKTWNAHRIARDIWRRDSERFPNDTLLPHVAEDWVQTMELVYKDPKIIGYARSRPSSDPVLANALFVAVDDSGRLRAELVDIAFDLRLFDSSGEVQLEHDITEMHVGEQVMGGFTDTAAEFSRQTTDRAKAYMAWFQKRIAGLPIGEQRAEITSKYVELSILLDSNSDQLGFPVDVLQVDNTGVHWIWRKPNCPAN
jgi:hypothetical protein